MIASDLDVAGGRQALLKGLQAQREKDEKRNNGG